MTGPKDPPLQRGGGRVLVLGGLGLAVAAAAVLALGAEDAGLLRLGIVAALWAALFGAFATVRLRREVTVGAARAEEMHTIYQLELDREIAARREHELTVERELREQAERRERDEIAALRGELQSLRETLRTLLGGDMLVERVALRAESTRLLSMPDHSRPVPDTRRDAADGAAAGASRRLIVAESPSPVPGRDRWDLDQPPDPPPRRREPVGAPARPAAQSRPPSPPRRETAPGAGAHEGAEPELFTRTAAELAGSMKSADRSWSPAVASAAGSGPSASGPAGPGPARAPAGWRPAVSSGSQPTRRRRADSRPDAPAPPSAPPVPPAPTSPPVPGGEAGSSTFQDNDPLGTVARPGTGTGRHSRPSAPRYGAATRPAPASSSPAPSSPAPNGPVPNSPAPSGNGAHSNGSGGTGGRRVDELLAEYGDGVAPRHRRRRAED